MQAQDVTVRYADHLVLALSAVRSQSAGVSRLAPGQPLTFETASGANVRSLRLPGVGTASLHGRGCLIEFDSGAEVDFDWDQARREVFDSWRLEQFARSIDERSISRDQLVLALRSDGRFVETEPGWFALTLLTEPQ